MFDGPTLVTFIAASLAVLLLPGPGVLYVIARTAAQGYRAGFASVLGLSAGALVHVLAAALGLSALLLASAHGFALIKAAGAGYLVYLGLRLLVLRDGGGQPAAQGALPLRRLFVDGIVVSLLNPKIALFFLAYLPQFVSPQSGAVSAQLLVLGLIYVGLALLTDGAYALLAGGARSWLGGRLALGRWPRLACGGLFIGLGLHAALGGRRG